MFFQTKAFNQSMKIKIGLLHSNKKKNLIPLMGFTTLIEKQNQSINPFNIQYMNNQ